ncbi:MAG: TolC family protein [Firmicutes bacterium]|nr:TolC family protein [Bacillota bacterium]
MTVGRVLYLRTTAAFLAMLIVFSPIRAFSSAPAELVGEGPEQILSLSAAVEFALSNSSSAEKAVLGRLSSELALDKRLTAYRPKATAALRPVVLTGKDSRIEAGWLEGLNLKAELHGLSGWEVSLSNQIQTENRETKGISLRADFALWPRPRHSAEVLGLLGAEESLSLARREEMNVAQGLVIETFRRYRALQISRERLALYGMEFEAKKMAQARLQAKAKEGHASMLEVLRAEQDEAEAQANYQRALRDYQREWNAFLYDLSVEGQWMPETLANDPRPQESYFDPNDTVDAAVEHDIAVAKAHQALLAAEREAKALQADGNLELKGSTGLWGTPSSNLGWEAYVGLTYPLLDGGKRNIELKEADLAVQLAKIELRDRQKQIKLDVGKMLSDLEWLRDQAQIAASRHQGVQLEQIVKRKQAAEGLIVDADVLAGERALKQAWLEWHEAVLAYHVAYLELLVATGQTLSGKEVNNF